MSKKQLYRHTLFPLATKGSNKCDAARAEIIVMAPPPTLMPPCPSDNGHTLTENNVLTRCDIIITPSLTLYCENSLCETHFWFMFWLLVQQLLTCMVGRLWCHHKRPICPLSLHRI